MLTYFQIRKLTRYFNCIDQDAKGYFTRDDVDAIAIRMAEKKNIDKSTDIFQIILMGMRQLWDNARIYGYSQDPHKVNLADWLMHEDQILSVEEMREGYVKKISRDVFDLMDSEGKGHFVESEYCDLMQSFGVEPGVTEWCFGIIDVEKKGYLTREEFVRVVEDFHLSEDRNAPGNYLFGAY